MWVGLWGESQNHLATEVVPVVPSQEKSHRRPGWLTRKVLLPLEERNNGGAHSGAGSWGTDPTQPPPPFPEDPRISDVGRGPQGKLS